MPISHCDSYTFVASKVRLKIRQKKKKKKDQSVYHFSLTSREAA